MDDIRQFPIQQDNQCKRSFIPWWLAEIAYREYVRQFGGSQSLERISERGGFGRHELITLLRGMSPFDPVCRCPEPCITHRDNNKTR